METKWKKKQRVRMFYRYYWTVVFFKFYFVSIWRAVFFFAFIFIYFFRFSLVRWLLIRSIPFNIQVVRDMSNKWKVTWELSEKHFIANMCEKSCKIYARTSKCHKTFPSNWLVETLDRISMIFVLFFSIFLHPFSGSHAF